VSEEHLNRYCAGSARVEPRLQLGSAAALTCASRHVRRRDFIALIGGAAAAWPLGSRAQPAQRVLRVGYTGIQPRNASIYQSFLKRMAELGYQEGRNFVFENIQVPSIEGYEQSYRNLVARRVDILMTAGNEPALRAARAAAGTLPLVFLAVDYDPLAKGYVASLARPGGTSTGIYVQQLELAAKRIELVREVLPLSRVIGLAWDTASREQADAAAEAARMLRFEPRLIEMSGQPPDYAAALRSMADAPGELVVIPASPILLRDREAIARALIERRIPSISAFRENAEAGVMMSYGIDIIGLFSDIADYVDRIAKGGKPGEMPVKASTRFHMTVNLKTADALGLSLPVTFTARAHEVFE
jgi:putative tryptophan/tyrosine transport system substrate-binding protein